jgi:hypothetical protein
MFKKLTPVLVVDAIEPVLALWEALGFQRAVEIPAGDSLGFVILQRDAVELMYQTFASVKGDDAAVLEGERAIGANAIFIEVENLDAASALVPKGTDIIEKRRETFYGSIEMILRDAAGNVITLAQMKS